MAYSTIYKLPFYSSKGVTGLVSIQKDGFSGDASTLTLLENGLKIDYKMGDWFDSIIGQSCSLEILNDADDFYSFIDLFTLEEREFKIVIDASDSNGNYVKLFDGFIDVNTVGQKYFKNSTVSLTGSNYLSKLQYTYPTTINTIQKIAPINILAETLSLTGKDTSIYVRNTLDPSEGSERDDNTVFNRVGIDTEVFWKDNINRETGDKIIEMILKPFSSYLYWWNDLWWIQRYDDIWTQNGTKLWCRYPISIWETSIGYQHGFLDENVPEVSLNFDTFDITDRSQTISMIPGVHQLELRTNTKPYLNIILNDFLNSGPEDALPYSSSPALRQWRYLDNENDFGAGKAAGYRNIGESYLKISNSVQRVLYPAEPEDVYISTKFEITVAPVDTVLNLKWKIGHTYAAGITDINARWFLRKGDDIDFITQVDKENDPSLWTITHANVFSFYAQEYEILTDKFDDTRIGNIDITIPLSDVLGMPDVSTDINFTFGLLVSQTRLAESESAYTNPAASEYQGDVVINVNPKKTSNLYIAEINTKNLGKESIELDLNDPADLNTASGLFTNVNYTDKVIGWGANSGTPLMNTIIGSKYQLYNKNRRKIEANLKYSGFLKPLSMYWDSADPSTKTYLLTNYSYFPINDAYKCEFWEYNNEDTINISYI